MLPRRPRWKLIIKVEEIIKIKLNSMNFSLFAHVAPHSECNYSVSIIFSDTKMSDYEESYCNSYVQAISLYEFLF